MNSPTPDKRHKPEAVSCVVSGSFKKFKPEIDQTIDALQGNNAVVLAPDKGWLYIPHKRIVTPSEFQFRPLPSEVGMSAAQVELEFLENLHRSDFVYVVNIDGYVGISVCLEIGTAMAMRIPIYCKAPIRLDPDSSSIWSEVRDYVSVATPEEAVREAQDDKQFMEAFDQELDRKFPALRLSKLAAPEAFQRLRRLAARIY